MTLETLLDRIPDFARDLRINLGNVLRQTDLTPAQLWGAAVASACASGREQVVAAIASEAAKHVPPEVIAAAKTAAAIMGMNNVYYRFLHLVGDEKYAAMPARLRMHGLRSHGVSQADFELWCVAVSAIHGCGSCMTGHDRAVREQGITAEAVLAAVRIASVIHAVATLLAAEPAAAA